MPCRHLSKVTNCVGWKRQEACRIVNPSRSPHRQTTRRQQLLPNERELLKILTVLYMESTEAEKSFSCFRRIHNWLRNTMTTERLSDLAVIAMHAKAVTIDRSVVCEKFVALHPRQMTASSLLADEVSQVFLLASISSQFLWRFRSLQCYSFQFVLPKSPCSGTDVGQLKRNSRMLWQLIGISHPLLKILDPPLRAVSELSLFSVEIYQSNYHYI